MIFAYCMRHRLQLAAVYSACIYATSWTLLVQKQTNKTIQIKWDEVLVTPHSVNTLNAY